MPTQSIPLRRRPVDYIFLAFFLINLLVITYMVDLEQLVVPDASHFTYPIWPPAPMVNLVHAYGRALDPLLLARPVWWQMTIWLDVLFFGPFYVCALYAFIKGREWIRVPALLYGASISTNVIIILGEELHGPHAAPHFLPVLLLNLPWILTPIALMYRLWRRPHPFQEPEPEPAPVPMYPSASGADD